MRRLLRDYLLLGLAANAVAAAALAAAPPGPRPATVGLAEVQAALQKARGGDRAALAAMAEAGAADAQAELGNLYFRGTGGPSDPTAARKWYEKAAAQKHPQASRTLGEMVMKGQGGRKDKKKAMKLWMDAEKAGDPLAPMLVADQMFSDITGGRKPGTGQYAFKGGIPAENVDLAMDWYREALKRDPRPDARQRAQAALNALQAFQSAAQVKVEKK